MKNSQTLQDLIRYEQEIKSKIRQTDNTILDQKYDRVHLQRLNELIQQEQVLIKYLQLETSKLKPEVLKIYKQNVTRFKRKIKEHKQYIDTYFGSGAFKGTSNTYQSAMQIEKQNAELLSQKQAMYDHQRLQDGIGHDINQQGMMLQQGIGLNRELRQEANNSEDMIGLIQAAVDKRRRMFYSLGILFVLAVIFILYRKIHKATSN